MDKHNTRRTFVRRILSVGAIAGLTGLFLGQLQERVGLLQSVKGTAGGTSGTALIIDAAPANTGISVTELDSDLSGGGNYVFQVKATSAAIVSDAVRADSASSIGGAGVEGVASASTGNSKGVMGSSLSTSGTGVLGIAQASSGSTFGVWGTAFSPDGIGVRAENVGFDSVGFRVSNGRSQFATIVDGTIPTGASSLTVTDSRVNGNSQVLVMLMGDPGSVQVRPHGPAFLIKNAVSWVSVTSGSFTVNLLASAAVNVPFRAFIGEKAP